MIKWALLQEGEWFRFRYIREDNDRYYSGWYQNELSPRRLG